MLSVTDQRALHGLARAFAADQEKQRGGKAANSRRKAVHCKLLELWSRSLINICEAVFGCQPARHPVFAAKFIQVEGRRRQLSQPGYVVHKGTPLLPPTTTEEDTESEASVLEAPVDLGDLEEIALEVIEPEGDPAASSSSAPVGSGSLERRSRSPQRSARADNRDLGSDVRGLDSFGSLSSGRPLPPEPPVAPPRPSGTNTAPKQKARPKPRAAAIVPVANITYIERDYAAFGQSLLRLNRQSPGVRAILSLDYHQVIDRNLDSTLEVFRCLQSHPHIAVIVLSKCSTRSLIDQAVRFLERVVAITGYTVREVPCFFVKDDAKADKLWRAIRGTDHEDTPVCHVDDKGSVVAGFESFSGYGWRGIRLAPSRRIELAEVVVPLITADQ